MANLEKLILIVHNVGQGLAVSFIEYPSKYVTHIDLGADVYHSPLGYLSSEYHVYPDIVYITHPHADHLTEVEEVLGLLSNNKNVYLHYQDYDWESVKEKELPNKRYLIDLFMKLKGQAEYGNYKGDCALDAWRYTPDKAKEIFGEADYINNSSINIVFRWNTFKIYIGGDLGTSALEKTINTNKFSLEAKNTDLYIAPHHGHKQGFSWEWPQNLGKPYLSLISVQDRDSNIAQGYSTPEFAKGWEFNKSTRYMLSTRNDGTIHVNMRYEESNPVWSFKFS